MTTKESNVNLDDLEAENPCAHHWIIGAPSGPISEGECKNCGILRTFNNAFEGSTWGSDVSLENLQQSTAGRTGRSGGNFGQIADRLKEEDNF